MTAYSPVGYRYLAPLCLLSLGFVACSFNAACLSRPPTSQRAPGAAAAATSVRPKAEYRLNEIGEAPPSRLERVGSV